MRAAIAIAAVMALAVAAFADDKPDPKMASRVGAEQAHLDVNQVATTQAATQPTDSPQQQIGIEQLRDDCQRLREKSALARAALERARAAALHRFSQTLESQQAQAAVANAQKELDAADAGDARMKAAMDKVNAKDTLANLQEKAIAKDAAVAAAAKSDAETSANLKLAEASLVKAQADKARADKAKADAAAAAAIPKKPVAPKIGDSEDDLAAYAKASHYFLSVRSETATGKIVELLYVYTGSVGIRGIPGTATDPFSTSMETIYIEDHKIVRIDH